MTNTEDFHALVALLREKDLNPCPACSHPHWLIGDGPVFVQSLDSEPEHAGFRAVPLFCPNCGLMHLHNFAALTGDTEIMESAAKENEEARNAD